MSWATFLIALVGPIAARVLVSLGLSLVTMAGLGAAVLALRTLIVTNANTLPAAGLMLAGLYGIWYCLGIALGAATFCVTWASTRGSWTLAKK